MPERPLFAANGVRWKDLSQITQTSFRCGFCEDKVSSSMGISIHVPSKTNSERPGVIICPECLAPTFRYPGKGEFFPSPSFGAPVQHVPQEISKLYNEARGCTSNNNFTAAVLLCRKILMHIAVQQGAPEGKNFVSYVDYLSAQGYVPPNGKHWVDHIRKKGNEANHEIVIMTPQDAQELITFLEMLLRFIYEFPNSIPKPPAPQP